VLLMINMVQPLNNQVSTLMLSLGEQVVSRDSATSAPRLANRQGQISLNSCLEHSVVVNLEVQKQCAGQILKPP